MPMPPIPPQAAMPRLTANNAAQHLTATFLPDGVRFCPTTASCMSEEEAWGMRLVSIGTQHTRTTIAPIAPTVEGARISYNHDDLTEWYINGPLGIEQGFTLNTARNARRDRRIRAHRWSGWGAGDHDGYEHHADGA